MERKNDLCKYMEDLGESLYYTKDELHVLEDFFGRKISFAYFGWVAFINEDGSHTYCDVFSKKAEQLMSSLYEKRIDSVRDFARQLDNCTTDDEVMNICTQVMLDYAKSWKDRNVNSTEDRRVKRILTSITDIKVETGNLVSECNKNPYSAIITKPYHGSVVINRLKDGVYQIEERAPLCGGCMSIYDSMHVKSCLIDFMKFIAY